jgi:hypothetical protein
LRLTAAVASRFARNTLEAVRREFPNKLDHVLAGPEDALPPSRLHPSFYGCYDWHSAVHGHWMLARLLRRFPRLPEAPAIRTVLDEHLAADRIRVETAYFLAPAHRGFERPYGWAWLLKLAAELGGGDGPGDRSWREGLRPLAEAVAAAFRKHLPALAHPNRTGVHGNTAFSLNLALDYARTAGDPALDALLEERARNYYLEDRNGPLGWEPGGEDFLSPCLEEAALMARILPPEAFRPWLEGFLPDLGRDPRLEPATVPDRTDPRMVHLDGLNLSRARCLRALAAALGPGNPLVPVLEGCARAHGVAALPHVVSGNYLGDHWLASFAVLLL